MSTHTVTDVAEGKEHGPVDVDLHEERWNPWCGEKESVRRKRPMRNVATWEDEVEKCTSLLARWRLLMQTPMGKPFGISQKAWIGIARKYHCLQLLRESQASS